jgi:hypothetical protein
MLNSEIKQDIEAVLNYLWHDEKKHYQESGYSKQHIFRKLKRLAKVVSFQYQYR